MYKIVKTDEPLTKKGIYWELSSVIRRMAEESFNEKGEWRSVIGAGPTRLSQEHIDEAIKNGTIVEIIQ
jgi:hypothetical protein